MAQPYRVLRGFLGPQVSHRLLQYILDNEPRFEHTGLGPESRIDRNARISRRLLDLGTFGSVIESRVAAMVPALTIFSSWLPHAVLPVTVPSRQFRDARFAINCWVLAATGAV